MRSLKEIHESLDELDHRPADALEDQGLDFKQWNERSMADAVDLVVEMAVCMANGGGGTVVFGVNDKVVGREKAVIGVPPEIDINKLKKAVYDRTDPKLTPIFEDLLVPEGSGRLIVMQVYSGLPPYTDTSGLGKIRIGKECKPLTGTLRRRIMIETGETDFTAEPVVGNPLELISAGAMEQMRSAAKREKAPAELLRLPDLDLLESLGVLHHRQMTRAAVLLAGTEDALRSHVPGYVWTHLRMRSETAYSDRADGSDSLPIALGRITDRIMADNPITTLEYGMFHFEYRTYPEIAIREALLNSLCHADFRLKSPLLIKQFPDRLEVSNPGGFIGGISPENILHHPPIPRNPCLADALAKLRLINRSSLGINRMFEHMLIEGKKPPIIREIGESVCVIFQRQDVSAPFRSFVAEESTKGRLLNVDNLLVLQYLTEHVEIDTPTAARLCQRDERSARDILSQMETKFSYLERGGTGRGTYWTMRPELYRRIAAPEHPERVRRIDWEAAKTRVFSILMDRARRGETGLSNQDIRQITHLDRFQVIRLMRELIAENPSIHKPGRGRSARYAYRGK